MPMQGASQRDLATVSVLALPGCRPPGGRSYVRIGDYRANPQLRASNALTFLRLVSGKREPLYASN